MTENAAFDEPAELESVTDDALQETSLTETFENALDVSEDVRLTECASSEEQEQRDGQMEEQTEEQVEGQTEEETDSPPTPESSCTESEWVVGASCEAVWSEDGQLYPAKVLSVDGGRCRVRFCDYGNEEDVDLSALKSSDVDLQTVQEWKPGSRCRAVYSEDGLAYPAVVLWVKGQRCRVRFNSYNNEEDQDVGSLLSANELHGYAAAKGSSWKSGVASGPSDWRRREENQGERGRELRSPWRDDQPSTSSVKEKASNRIKAERDSEEKEEAEKPANHSSPFFPPFPPPQLGSRDYLPFIPPSPPPPLWTSGEKTSDSDNAASSMLMMWYMCGFHTGSYMARQELKSLSKR